MRPGILLLLFTLLLGACGGSSSETPWPAEPETPALGPSDEGADPADPRSAPEDANEGAAGPADAGR
ncbi:hypothetical protein SOCEGT47_078950 [Sorangium cellulosum]|jgi:hypothetical protein|uniref:Secreted protein n=1 Tax=Sorangium cellulosum TaxID=56 RepID=A0A4P2QD57_SORCE|nr:hypothetical protein [Sorangium cellulosum]AUX27308.1 hypothetical protein SOCEGT47_078950 [Sorangium cellulosum]